LNLKQLILIRIKDWNNLLDDKNVHISIDIFNNKINDFILASTNFFTYTKRMNNIKKCKLKSWIFLGLITSIRVRENMYN
jgi:hypothetical protein